MKWDDFKIGFWHPFGPRPKSGGRAEEPDDILERKTGEIRDRGWTLWSFQGRRNETLEGRLQQIRDAQVSAVLVVCSDSLNAELPRSKPERCRWYKPVGREWQSIPACIEVPRPSLPRA